MRQKQQVPILQFAPGARIPIAQFHKIDRPVEFRPPALWLYFAHALIYLDEGTGPHKRIEREILKPDVAIQAVAQIQVLQQRDRNLAPDFHDAR